MASRTIYALAIILLLIVAGIVYENQSARHSSGSGSQSSSTSSAQVASGWLDSSPSFVGSNATIDYPPDYSSLANYTLGLINADRQSAGASPVALSMVPSGQQHADSLSYFGTTGHWDVQGYKPYMRYSLLGGTGYMAENVAMGYCISSAPSVTNLVSAACTTQTIKNGLAAAEYQMMNDDSACCGNGHREDIVDKAHNLVSLGVAYNTTSRAVYLVEDFEDSFIQNGSAHLSANTMTLQGSTNADLAGWTGNSSAAYVVVYHDPTPSPIPANELSPSSTCGQYSELTEPLPCQYLGAYSAGTQAAVVLAPCPERQTCGTGNFTFALTWSTTSTGEFEISVFLGQLEQTYGGGVYSFYLWPDGDTTEPITSTSVFATSSAGP